MASVSGRTEEHQRKQTKAARAKSIGLPAGVRVPLQPRRSTPSVMPLARGKYKGSAEATLNKSVTVPLCRFWQVAN